MVEVPPCCLELLDTSKELEVKCRGNKQVEVMEEVAEEEDVKEDVVKEEEEIQEAT